MAQLRVRLEWITGLKRPIFRNVRLLGSWDADGRYSNQWRTAPMEVFTAADGCPAWRADALLDDSQRGWTFYWGVTLHFFTAPGRPSRAVLADPLPPARRQQVLA